MNLELTSIEFVVLFPVVVVVYYVAPRYIQKYYLLLINVLFYTSFGTKYIVVVLLEAVIIWLAAGLIHKNIENQRNCRILFIGTILLLIAILLFFKVGSVNTKSIVAPLGVSFYTLQAISYVVDVKYRVITYEKNLIRLLIFLSFFPTITSGPIYRYKDFQIEFNRNKNGVKPQYDLIINGLLYMLYGYFLKLVVAARAGVAVNSVFDDYASHDYGGIILAIAAVLYSVQLFADFAGYSAIVIGTAQILGYTIPENFNAPYFSMSIKEFWGRWHISFSTWLRDYVYIPLGGNRKGRFRKYLNIIITFIISGIWHGVDGWHFLLWGVIHGVYQIVGDVTRPFVNANLCRLGVIEDTWFCRFIKRLFTFSFVTVAWIIFRTGAKDAINYIKAIITSWGVSQIVSGEWLMIGVSVNGWMILIGALIVMAAVDSFRYRTGLRFDELVSSQGTLAKCMTFVVISLTILILGIYGDQHDASYFIYRDF